jgi:hypothetical protein
VLQGQPDRTAKQLQSSGLGKVSTGIALSSSLDKGVYAHKYWVHIRLYQCMMPWRQKGEVSANFDRFGSK